MQSPVPVPFLHTHTQSQPARRDEVRREHPTTEKSRFADRLQDREKTTAAEEPSETTEAPEASPTSATAATAETTDEVGPEPLLSDSEASLLVVPEDGSTADPLLAALAALLGLGQAAPTTPVLPSSEAPELLLTDGLAQDGPTILPGTLTSEVDPLLMEVPAADTEPMPAMPMANPAQGSPTAVPHGGLPAPALLTTMPAPVKPTAETRQPGGSDLLGPTASPTLNASEIQAVGSTAESQTHTDQPLAQPPVPDTLSRREQSAAGGKTIDIQALAPASSEAAPHQPEAANVERVRRPEVPMANPMDKVVAQQVTRALLREGPEGQRTLSLRLTPPELGTIRVEIIERGGVLQARLHAEDDAVRHALERQLTHMRQDLRANDAPVRDVHLGDAWSGDLARRERDGAQNRSRHQGRDGGFSLEPIASAATAALPSPDIIADERVDARA